MVTNNSGTKILLDIFIVSIAIVTVFIVYQEYKSFIKELFFGVDATYTVYIDTAALSVTVADTESERIQGLSGATHLPDLEGKLFIFDEEKRHGIWMKDMLFPIDILWFDANLELVYIEENVDPATFPKVFVPDNPARFVVEVNAHLVDALRIQVGDRLTLPSSILPKDIKTNLNL